jgi:hypothetical protein
VTTADIRDGRVRIPRATMHLFPEERGEVRVRFRGVPLHVRWDPRLGPPQRSGVLRIGRELLRQRVVPGETLAVIRAPDRVIELT